MKLTEFRELQGKYRRLALARKPERMNVMDDTPWPEQVIEEMLVDVFERLTKLEAMLYPAEEQVALPSHPDPERVEMERAEALKKFDQNAFDRNAARQ